LGTGIDQATLTKLFEKHLKAPKEGAALSAKATKYFGGETRSEAFNGLQTVFIGYDTTAPSAELATLASYLSPKPSVKWSQGISPLAAEVPAGSSINTVYLPYSDAALFGFLIQSPTVEDAKKASESVVKVLKDTASGSSLKAEDVKKAAAKAKFVAANATEARHGLVSTFGPKLLTGSETSFDSFFSAIDKIDGSSVSKITSSLIKSQPTYVVVGDINTLPYKDEIGL